MPRTRTARTWTALAGGGIALVLVLVFVLQNLSTATTTFFGARWTIPLGVDLLFAAVLGGLVVFLVGTTRMLQLRRLLRRATTSDAAKDRKGRARSDNTTRT